MRQFIILSASWFGTGFSPFASGTVGTLGAIPFYLLLTTISLPLYLLTLAGLFLFFLLGSGTRRGNLRRKRLRQNRY